MANKINISIPKPCKENWNEMTSSQKGKFCASCQKDVIDFTTASDREILNYYNQNSKICGRFTSSQLNHTIFIPKEKSSIWMLATASIIAFLGLGSQTAKAQESIKTEQTDKKQLDDSTTVIEAKEKSMYHGIVYDENKNPIPGANVMVKGTKIITQTDFDGKFSISAKKGDVLIFSYIGYNTVEFKIKNNPEITITIKPTLMMLGEIVIMKED
ncbi:MULTISPECIES: carboxypeptidase-like regulatory domain-containing protein [Flavobacterium]|uniref:carboxypeptidase-like regulatory domain-containing protein n=1 Tax=Flavobacterium TaxID=237 RepID=UPI00188AB12E|nr:MULTISPECIES: carboxypeptidase-like regulatory domain-containing protein [Flavobacterium]MBF4471317.1 carboxypeptidase-like regulatory domain-containing protein [Flavobacterium sp. HJJ]